MKSSPPMKIMTYALLILTLSACQKNHQQNPVLQKANQEHLEAIRIHTAVKKILKKPLPNATESQRSRLDSLGELIQLWEESVVEVPGFDHNTEHNHHEHKEAPKMTDDSMLSYQQNAKKAIIELRAGLEAILKEIQLK
jgi:uncharacterized short protein YbdD (DUF466 family)